MKIKINFSLLFLTIFTVVKSAYSQEEISRFEELKAWKLSYIIKNTSMNPEELEIYKCIFEDYENNYHNEVWSKARKNHKVFYGKNKRELFDKISSSEAMNLIYDFDSNELRGMELKHKRNRRLLKKIRPEIVLSILYQEKNFNRELFKKRGNDSKNNKDQN
jgi:hypothetical protein